MNSNDTDFKQDPGAETFVEAGDAFTKLASSQRQLRAAERFDVVVIGAGQAGLSVGYHLLQQGLRFVILDGAGRIGDSWRKRWDSLRLFTPARYDGLDGMPFPGDPRHFPTKDEMADYLERYARHFELPVRLHTRVHKLSRCGARYLVTTADGVIEADQVVVAMASYQQQKAPHFARELASSIVQVASDDYKRPAQLLPGPVLIAGAGNSGSEIAMELHRSHPIFMSGRDTGQVPFRPDSFWGHRLLGPFVLRFVFHRLLTIATPMGRKMQKRAVTRGTPLIRVRAKDLMQAQIQRVPRVVGVRDGLPLLEDDRTLDVKNVVWCTGYNAGFDWIDASILDERGEPRHVGGIVPDAPGLFFVGLHFLYSMSSTMIHGVGRDAERIARAVARGALERERRPYQSNFVKPTEIAMPHNTSHREPISTQPILTPEAVVRRLIDEGFGRGRLEIADELIADDVVEHQDFGANHPPGPFGVKAIIASLHRAFPDYRISIEALCVQGDVVWTRNVSTGTSRGPLLGYAPTGKAMRVTVFDVLRVVDGKVVEHWGVPDRLGVLMQIGALQRPGT